MPVMRVINKGMPVKVWTELVLPYGTRMAGALAAPLVASADGASVRVPPGIGQVRVAVTRVADGLSGVAPAMPVALPAQ